MEAKESGSFSAYLEALAGRPEETGQSADKGDVLTRVLVTLADDDHKPISELQVDVGLDFGEFAKTMGLLESTGLITMSGEPSQERVSLTTAGQTLAVLTKSPLIQR